MTPHRTILKNTAALATSRVIERASTVVLSIAVARELGAGGLGVYATAMVYYNLVFMAAEMGSNNYLVREIAKEPHATGRLLGHTSFMSTTLGLVIAGLGWLIVPHLGYSSDMSSSVRVILLAVAPAVLKTVQEAAFIAHQKVQFITYSQLIAAFVNIGTTLTLLALGFGVVALVAAFVLIQVVISVCYYFFLNRYVSRFSWQFDRQFAWTMVKEMKAFTGSSVLAGLLARPEVLILSFMKNEAAVGLYSAALRLVDIWQLVPQTYMSNVFPVLSRSYHEADRKAEALLRTSLKYLMLISLPIMAGLIAAADPIIRLVYGAGFASAALPLRILAFVVPVGGISAVLWRALAARGEQYKVFGTQVAATAVRVGLGYPLIAGAQVLGACVSTVLGTGLQCGLLAFCLRHDGTQLKLLRICSRVVMAALAMGGVAYVLSQYLQLWALIPASVAIYTIALLGFGAITSDELASLRKLASRHS